MTMDRAMCVRKIGKLWYLYSGIDGRDVPDDSYRRAIYAPHGCREKALLEAHRYGDRLVIECLPEEPYENQRFPDSIVKVFLLGRQFYVMYCSRERLYTRETIMNYASYRGFDKGEALLAAHDIARDWDADYGVYYDDFTTTYHLSDEDINELNFRRLNEQGWAILNPPYAPISEARKHRACSLFVNYRFDHSSALVSVGVSRDPQNQLIWQWIIEFQRTGLYCDNHMLPLR